MYCSTCGAQNPDAASFCAACGQPLAGAVAVQEQPSGAVPLGPPGQQELASYGQRFGSWIIDFVLGVIPYLGLVFDIINWVMYRRGSTIGLSIVRARIIRENGDVSGFYHTWMRAVASILSLLPLGLGFWWMLWDPYRQTWHDKIMHTYVLRDTSVLNVRPGTSSRGAVIAFWVLLVVIPLAAIVVAFVVVFALIKDFS
ncbi:MAG: RDD family protein [Chloroflexi bacterium]|nr:RDD family protein [Chloroflexota bacterium]